jgi:hypothetical protein
MIYQQCCHKFATRMNRLLVAILTFVIFSASLFAQSDLQSTSVHILNRLWEKSYVQSKVSFAYAPFEAIPAAFPSVAILNNEPKRKRLQEQMLLKKEALLADKGLSFDALGQQNFNPQVNEDNLIYRSRATAGVDWDLLANGLLDKRYQARDLEAELAQSINQLGSEGVKQVSYVYKNNIIYYFNQKKLKILLERQGIAEQKLEILNRLAQSNQIPATLLLDNYQQLIDVAGQFNLYQSFNTSVKSFIDTSVIQLESLLPAFDINVEALKNICGMSQTPLPTTNQLLNKRQPLWSREIKLSTNLRYNYFDLINNTTNRNFISLGINTSIPFRLFAKPYIHYHTFQQQAFSLDKTAENKIKWMEISNLMYEFKYKLKQLGAWEEKQRIQRESLRIYQGLHQINDPSFQPIQALDAIDRYYALEIEKLDLIQQLYLKLGEIQVKIPDESVNRYIIPALNIPEDNQLNLPDENPYFIYTRGTLNFPKSPDEKARIVVTDEEKKIIGDIATHTDGGEFEMYFPKAGNYYYTLKSNSIDNPILGEINIVDSSLSAQPAYLQQLITITRSESGKAQMTIENNNLDSISRGIEAAEKALERARKRLTEEFKEKKKQLLNDDVPSPENKVRKENLIIKTPSIRNSLNTEQSNSHQDSEQPPSSLSKPKYDTDSQKIGSALEEPEKVDSNIANSLQKLTNNDKPKSETSLGTSSLDIRAAHIIQLILEEKSETNFITGHPYLDYHLNDLIKKYPDIGKEYKNKREIDSIQHQIYVDKRHKALEEIALKKQLAALEYENKKVINATTNAIKKPLQNQIKKRIDAFNLSEENTKNNVLYAKMIELQKAIDSLLKKANDLKSLNVKSDIFTLNENQKEAFQLEMLATKKMQFLLMAIDAKGVFELYTQQEIEYLRKASDDQIKKEFRSSKTYLATTDAVVGEPYYVKSKSNDKNSTVEKDFFYTVQIGAFKSTFYIEQWDEWSTIIGEKIESGLTRVMIGKEATSEQAEISKRKLQSLGYADAFVVLYNNGERLPIRDILNITEKIDTTLLTSDRAKAFQMMKDKENKMASWSRGIYVWSKAFVNVPAERIMDDFKQWKIDHVILSPTTDAKNWVKAQPLIDLLNQNDIAVEWMIGNNKWLGHSITGKLDSLNNQLQTWNIKTLHLDIEPHTLPDYKKNKEKYHRQYLELVDEANIFCKKNNLQLNLSIPLQLPEDVLQKIAELNITTTLMAYENPNVDAIKRRSQEEVQFGQTKTIIALRAKDYQKSADMEKDLQLLKDWIPSHRIVIHDYNTYKQISSNEKR